MRPSRTTWVVLLVMVVVAVLVVVVLAAGGGASREAVASPVPLSSPVSSSSPVRSPVAVVMPAPTPATSTMAATPAPGSLADLIAQLPIRPEHRKGYSRDLFEHWIDADGDGCSTRSEVLIDEAVEPPFVGPDCRLSGGRWHSAYDGKDVDDAADLDIDHVVALAEAWDSGAYAWPPDRREAFANDLDVPWALAAVTSGSNRAKSDLDPADWLPPLADAGCTFVTDWVAVKVRWSLTIDRAEQRALLDEAVACGAVPVPSVPLS